MKAGQATSVETGIDFELGLKQCGHSAERGRGHHPPEERSPWRQAFSPACPSWTRCCLRRSTAAPRQSLRDVRGHGVGKSPPAEQPFPRDERPTLKTDSRPPEGLIPRLWRGCPFVAERVLLHEKKELLQDRRQLRLHCAGLLHIAFGSCPSGGRATAVEILESVQRIAHLLGRSIMTTADPSNAHATCGVPDRAGPGSAATAADVADEHSLGLHAAATLATEHWSLLASRSLIWNEAMTGRRFSSRCSLPRSSPWRCLPMRPASERKPPPWRWCYCRSCCCSASPPMCVWCGSTPKSSSSCWR
jgi:hypothetical protein